jgi:CRP-like cAMP-binding protein/mannose-6-phosphate isomerase-like protein (cupin superfamily)
MPPAKLGGRSRASFIPDAATIKKNLATLPVSTYAPGETVIAAGETTGKLLFLSQGSVEVAKEGTQIALISEPGAVFGELAALLDQPHTADVRALERSEFSVADAATLLASDPTAALYVAAILAGRLVAANGALVEVKRELESGKPRVAVARTVGKIAELLSSVDVTAASSAPPGYVDATARTGKAANDAPPAKLGRRSAAPLVPGSAAIQKSLAMLPVSTYEPGETVIAAGETTGKLLFLRQGLVEVAREGKQIARISEPGAVFGELAALLDQPHTADVRALERTEFSVADAATLLASDPTAALYVASILAGRLDAANGALVELKHQLETGKPRAAVARTVDKIAELLTNESFAEDLFLDELIPKPWGREYRIYADNFYDVWKLELGPGKATSLHYHPRKDTVLMCLCGHGRIRLADTDIDILAGKHIFIGCGVTHATANIGEGELELIEVELPRNKFDLFRVEDSYGRTSQPYESTGVASRNLPGLVQYDGIPGAKYRPTDIHGHYRFTIGKAFVEQDGDYLLLAVPVGPHSLTRGIEVFNHGSLEGMSLNETQHCFTITVSV